MKKVDKIFLGLILVEIIVLGVLYLVFQNPCGSPCDVDGLLNPLNIFNMSPKLCAQVCVVTLHPLTYLVADILILTILIYLIIIIKNIIVRR